MTRQFHLFPEPAARTSRVLSYGAGLDSFAMLVEALRRGERPDAVAFVDVTDPDGIDPGEWPGTYRHVREVAIPLCERERIHFHWLDSARYPVRDARSLYAWMRERGQIPMANKRQRICTTVAKVERFERWLTDTYGTDPVEVWIGFEAGEETRAAKDPNAQGKRAQRRNRFPLIEWGLCRCRCEALVRDAGLPVPRKSACMFCPFSTTGDFQTLARELPGRFAQVAELEARKPPTARNGLKLTIKNFRWKDLPSGEKVTTSKFLPELVKTTYRPKKTGPCPVCGAPQRATKATGCDYLEEPMETAAQ